jgi:4-hydroxyphenylpyruvate dioxygenase
MGFEPIAYRGLETGARDYVTHVVRSAQITLALTSPLNPGDKTFGDHHCKHGDGVRDIVFNVEDCRRVYEYAVSKGAKSVRAPEEIKDEHGTMIVATIETFGDTHHSLVQNVDYEGPFMPGFIESPWKDPFNEVFERPRFVKIDHTVGNQPDLEMEPTVQWYEKMLQFHRYWTVDDTVIHTEYSSLRSTFMSDFDETIIIPVNEPAPGKKKSQIQEFVEFYGGPGVQHIALETDDII